MIRNTLITGSIFTLTVSVLIFIHFSNDHKECGTIVKSHLDVNGNTVRIVEHTCKENYYF